MYRLQICSVVVLRTFLAPENYVKVSLNKLVPDAHPTCLNGLNHASFNWESSIQYLLTVESFLTYFLIPLLLLNHLVFYEVPGVAIYPCPTLLDRLS